MNKFWDWFDALEATAPVYRLGVLLLIMMGTVIGIPTILMLLGVTWWLMPMTGIIAFCLLSIHKVFFRE